MSANDDLPPGATRNRCHPRGRPSRRSDAGRLPRPSIPMPTPSGSRSSGHGLRPLVRLVTLSKAWKTPRLRAGAGRARAVLCAVGWMCAAPCQRAFWIAL